MKYISPSDRTAIAPNYTNGDGYYTTDTLVASMLQIPAFSSSTNPTSAEVGTIIKNVEDRIDSITGSSWRPIIYRDEYHNFSFSSNVIGIPTDFVDYVGFVQLDNPHIRKLIRLEVYQGNNYLDLASATATVTMDDYTSMVGGTTQINLKLPNNGLVFNLLAGTTNSRFDSTYGNQTAAEELVALINETFPANTSTLTGATAAKGQTDSTGAKQVSDFFYATLDSENNNKVIISSLLPSDDGANCSIYINGSSSTTSAHGITVTEFTDKEELGRLSNFWTIGHEGRIFFRKQFPYQLSNSIRVTYIAGNQRVPASISEAATKLACCEILRHDDSTVLIGESGNQITPREKYDLLTLEANETLNAYKSTVVLVD